MGITTKFASLLLAVALAGPAGGQEIAQQMFARGLEAEKAGKIREASKHYESAAAGGISAAFGRLGMLAANRGANTSAADWYDRGAATCDGASQLGLVLAYRMGNGRKADGSQAYAWLIAAQRSKNNWTAEELERLATLERDIPAYMPARQIAEAYCLGLDYYINACGGSHIMSRLERWVYCE